MLSGWTQPALISLKPNTGSAVLIFVLVGIAASFALSMWQSRPKPASKAAATHTTYQHVSFGCQFSEKDASNKEEPCRRMRLTKEGDTSVRVVDGVISAKECKNLISLAETGGFSKPDAFSDSARSCERLHTVDVALSDEIMKRLRPFLPEVVLMDGARWKLNRFTHHWRYVKYRRGGHFIPHFDGSKLLPWHEMSVFTVQIYLNEDFTGGSTRFYTDFTPDRQTSHQVDYGHVTKFNPPNPPTHSVTPRTGAALIFNHASQSMLHDGEAVLDGLKYILRGDVLYTAIKDDIPILQNPSPSLPPHHRSWCPLTASKFGTRTIVGQVWWCECAGDRHGADCSSDSCTLQPTHAQPETPEDPEREVEVEIERVSESVPPGNHEVITAQLDPSGSEQCGGRVRGHDPRREAARYGASDRDASGRGMEMILLSGKRASGKDYVGAVIEAELKAIGVRAHRAALGEVNKRAYAEKTGVELERLMSDRAFKEQHRIAMVAHHAERNRADPEWCLKRVVERAEQEEAQVLVLTDLRTREDLKWFEARAHAQRQHLVLLRVDASDKVRAARGWDEDAVKDKLITEVDLDSFVGWSAQLDNSAPPHGQAGAQMVVEWVRNTVLPRCSAARRAGWQGAA